MPRFRRLTDGEVRQLTRRELLARAEREQAYWHRKKALTGEDQAAEREFRRIMRAYLDPAAGLADLADWLEGRSAGRYWDTRPCDDGQPGGGGDPVIAYARMLLRREPAAEPPDAGT